MRAWFLFIIIGTGIAACESPDSPDRTVSTEAPRLEAASAVVDLALVKTDDWINLFNGSDLDGWIPKVRGYAAGENPGETFRVQDGLLTVSYDGFEMFEETFGHLFHEHSYSWYHLEVEYRFTGEQLPDGPGWAFRNSGIMVHGQSPESMGVDQDFPISIEVQLLGGNGVDERTTANLCTPGTNVVFEDQLDTRHCISSTSGTYHGDQWVTASVTVFGDSLIVHGVNGEEVLRYTEPQMGGGNVDGHDPAVMEDGRVLNSGSISLQSESHPIQFRRVALIPLAGCMDRESPAYRPFYVRPDAAACDD
jgi:hypothetical protein